ncbi:hypothetical protein AAFN46_10050 [Pseudomonas sp. CAU 1711]|uniref:hypothetical protein n=1 Tax=Pseudomonas sp. CAU 1711 TaxID=3140356 RepID=UPI003260A2E9
MLLLLVVVCAVFAEEQVVRYPRPETDFDKRTEYPLKLLQLGLERAGQRHVLRPTQQIMNQGRALQQLKLGQGVDVVWSMTSQQREQDLLPVRIPIYKGLIGWRIFLINEADRERFERPMTLSDLQQYRLVQGHDWPDTSILRANGFQVTGSASYQAIFEMLAYKRVDLFPRSIVEIWAEQAAHAEQGIGVEGTKLLYYPTAFYYFVAPDNPALAQTIERGLNLAIEDGSFERLFQHYHAELLARARLDQRQVYRLENPILPAATPLQRKELWYRGY